jgi:hypothetical protein
MENNQWSKAIFWSHDELTGSDLNSSLAPLIMFHLETIHKLAGAIAELVFLHMISSVLFCLYLSVN